MARDYILPGLIVDGDLQGRYAGQALQEYATYFGWTGKLEDADSETYYDAQDEAEEFLNQHVALKGNCFHWDGGNFFYSSLAVLQNIE